MKSLEIVNALLATMKIADNIDLNDCEEYFEKIKQDLEVLEILRKHLKYQELHFMEDTPRIEKWLEENENE